MQGIRLLQIEDNRVEAHQTQHWLAEGGEFRVECVTQLSMGIERLAQEEFDIVLLDLNLPDSRGEETFDKLYAQFPEIPIVVLTGEHEEAIGPSTVSKGAQDYLTKNRVTRDALVHVLRYALARHTSQQEKLRALQLSKSGRVIGFIGAKGGTGTTTAALNVAVALAQQGKSVILAEMRPSFGTLTLHLPQHPAHSLRTLLELPTERIGQYEMNAVLCKGPSGIWVLFGPKADEEDFKEPTPEQTKAIINCMSKMAEFIILDLPAQPSPVTKAAATLCHFALIVTEREPVSVKAGQVVSKQLQNWGMHGNLAGGVVQVGAVVVNRTIYSNYSMPLDDIASLAECEVVGLVPWGAAEHLRAHNEGVPIVLLQPDSDTALSYVAIANQLVETVDAPQRAAAKW